MSEGPWKMPTPPKETDLFCSVCSKGTGDLICPGCRDEFSEVQAEVERLSNLEHDQRMKNNAWVATYNRLIALLEHPGFPQTGGTDEFWELYHKELE